MSFVTGVTVPPEVVLDVEVELVVELVVLLVVLDDEEVVDVVLPTTGPPPVDDESLPPPHATKPMANNGARSQFIGIPAFPRSFMSTFP